MRGRAAAALVPENEHEAMAALVRGARPLARPSGRGHGSTGKTSTKDILLSVGRTAAQLQPSRKPQQRDRPAANAHPDRARHRGRRRRDGHAGARAGTRAESHRQARDRGDHADRPGALELFGTVERSPRRRPRSSPSSRAAASSASRPASGCSTYSREDVEVVTYGEEGDVELLGRAGGARGAPRRACWASGWS